MKPRIPPHVYARLITELVVASKRYSSYQSIRAQLTKIVDKYIEPDHPHTRSTCESTDMKCSNKSPTSLPEEVRVIDCKLEQSLPLREELYLLDIMVHDQAISTALQRLAMLRADARGPFMLNATLSILLDSKE